MSQQNLPESFPPPKRRRPRPSQSIPPSYAPQQRRRRSTGSANPTYSDSNRLASHSESSHSSSPDRPSRPAISRRLKNQGASPASATSKAQEIPIQPRSESRFAGRTVSTRTRVMPADRLPAESSSPQRQVAAAKLEPTPPSRSPRIPRAQLPARRVFKWALTVLIIFVIAWPLYLWYLVDSQLNRVDALSALPASEGETWLIAGSDQRSDGSDGGVQQPWVQGARADSIMLLRKVNGVAELVSLPRDTAVEIPGHGLNKLNASYAFGGPKLLVKTVEGVSGVKVDHYVEVTMGAVTQLVDAVGGVELCLDYDVNDADSALKWKSGCHQADGATALAFSRMRHQDPRGDIGRAERQRQVVSKLSQTLITPSTFLNPFKQRDLANAGASNLTCDSDSGAWALGKMLFAYRSAANNNLTGAPPISKLAYYKGGHGAMVQLDPNKSPSFWKSFQQGTLQPNQYHQFK